MEGFLPRDCEGAAARGRPPIRLAATGDLHVRGLVDLEAFPGLSDVRSRADMLIIAGDLTENGRMLEAECAAELLACVGLPVIAVLGNHDLRSLRRTEFRRILERRGIEILVGEATIVNLATGVRVGIAGATGSGGGFGPRRGSDAEHARAPKRLALRSTRECAALDHALLELEADIRIAVMHYSPTTTTLGHEPLAKYWMLGNAALGAVIDRRRPDLVVHGHAHLGQLIGATPGGTPVRNVALPVVGRVYLESLDLPDIREPNEVADERHQACG